MRRLLWCCQANYNLSPIGGALARSRWVQAASNFHSAKVTGRFALKV